MTFENVSNFPLRQGIMNSKLAKNILSQDGTIRHSMKLLDTRLELSYGTGGSKIKLLKV